VSATTALIEAGKATRITLLSASTQSVVQGVTWINDNSTATTIREKMYVEATRFINSIQFFESIVCFLSFF